MQKSIYVIFAVFYKLAINIMQRIPYREYVIVSGTDGFSAYEAGAK